MKKRLLCYYSDCCSCCYNSCQGLIGWFPELLQGNSSLLKCCCRVNNNSSDCYIQQYKKGCSNCSKCTNCSNCFDNGCKNYRDCNAYHSNNHNHLSTSICSYFLLSCECIGHLENSHTPHIYHCYRCCYLQLQVGEENNKHRLEFVLPCMQ